MNNHRKFKIFVILILFVFGSTQMAFASGLPRYLDYNPDNVSRSLIIQPSPNNDMFHYNASGSELSNWMNMGNAHKYLGYGTLLFAAAAAVSGGNNAFHKGAGVGAAIMAVGACTTGYMEYSDYFDISDGFSKHNIHIVLGTLAAVGFVATAASALSSNDSSHAGLGIASTLAVAVPIVILKW